MGNHGDFDVVCHNVFRHNRHFALELGALPPTLESFVRTRPGENITEVGWGGSPVSGNLTKSPACYLGVTRPDGSTQSCREEESLGLSLLAMPFAHRLGGGKFQCGNQALLQA